MDQTTFAGLGVAIADVGNGVGVSHDGRWGAFGGFNVSTVRVHDLVTGEPLSPVLDLARWRKPGDAFNIRSLAFDWQASRLLVGLPSGTGVVFETSSWQAVQAVEPDDAGGVVGAVFGRDGSLLVTRGVGGEIALRNPDTLKVEKIIEGGITSEEAHVAGPYLSNDNHYLLTVRDQTPRLWHLPTATDIGTFPHDLGMKAGGAHNSDPLRLATIVGPHAISWNLDLDAWPEIACGAVGRHMTVEEWEQFGPRDEPYSATCPQYPALG